MIIKAISLWQLWAQLVVIGAKKFETRSWSTTYRGPLLIHAAQKFPDSARALFQQEPFKSAMRAAGIANSYQLRTGAIIGRCTLIDVHLITARNAPNEPERSFGDYSPGRYAWRLADAVRYSEFIPYAAHQRLFDVPINVIRNARAAERCAAIV